MTWQKRRPKEEGTRSARSTPSSGGSRLQLHDVDLDLVEALQSLEPVCLQSVGLVHPVDCPIRDGERRTSIRRLSFLGSGVGCEPDRPIVLRRPEFLRRALYTLYCTVRAQTHTVAEFARTWRAPTAPAPWRVMARHPWLARSPRSLSGSWMRPYLRRCRSGPSRSLYRSRYLASSSIDCRRAHSSHRRNWSEISTWMFSQGKCSPCEFLSLKNA